MNDQAVTEFSRRRDAIFDKLIELIKLADDHFGQAPDGVNWGHVGTLDAIAEHITAAHTTARALSLPPTVIK